MALSNFYQICFPYCLEKDKSTGEWLILNREYKPVGQSTNQYCVYDEVNKIMPIKTKYKITNNVIKKLNLPSDSIVETESRLRIYLYSPKDNWEIYQKRLQILSGVKIKID